MPTDPWAAFPAVSAPTSAAVGVPTGGADPWAAFPVAQASPPMAPTPQPEPWRHPLIGGVADASMGIMKSAGNTLTGVYDLLAGPASEALTQPGVAFARLLDAVSPQQRGLTDLMLNRPAQPRVPPRQSAREALSADPSQPGPTIVPTDREKPYYQLANLAQFLLPTATGAGPIANAALAGGQTGALTLAQGGSPSEAATSAATAGLLPPAINKAAGAVEGTAARLYERALGATTGPMKAAAQRIAPEMIDRGVVGSLPRLAAMGEKKANEVGQEISAAYDAATQRGVTVSTTPALQNLDRLKARYVTVGTSAQGPTRVVTNPEAVGRIEKIEDILNSIGPSATPNQLWQVRQALDEIVGPGGFGQPLGKGTAKGIAKAARAGLQTELDKSDASIRALNREYGIWADLDKVASSTARRRVSQELPLASMLFGAAGAGGQFARTGDISDSLSTGVAMGALARGAKSPAFRTRAAVGLDRVAGAAGANADPIARLLAALLGGAAGTPEPTQR